MLIQSRRIDCHSVSIRVCQVLDFRESKTFLIKCQNFGHSFREESKRKRRRVSSWFLIRKGKESGRMKEKKGRAKWDEAPRVTLKKADDPFPPRRWDSPSPSNPRKPGAHVLASALDSCRTCFRSLARAFARSLARLEKSRATQLLHRWIRNELSPRIRVNSGLHLKKL